MGEERERKKKEKRREKVKLEFKIQAVTALKGKISLWLNALSCGYLFMQTVCLSFIGGGGGVDQGSELK